MNTLYREHSCDAKYDAQNNLSGRTHYVDDDTLRFHHSRILDTFHTDGGLLFSLLESCALDMNNSKRGFRFVIFDLFGHVIERAVLEGTFTTKKAAKAAMWEALNGINAVKITREGIKREREGHKREMSYISDTLRELKASGKV